MRANRRKVLLDLNAAHGHLTLNRTFHFLAAHISPLSKCARRTVVLATVNKIARDQTTGAETKNPRHRNIFVHPREP